MIYYPKAVGSVAHDTKSIQDAIDVAARSGGGMIYLSSGVVYRCGTLILRSHITLHLENGARLEASGSIADYKQIAEFDADENCSEETPVLRKPSFAFLYAYDADSVAISGDGIIDGNCFQFVKRVNPYHCKGDFQPRPTLLYLEKCNNLVVRGVTLQNSPFWSLHMAGCDTVLVSGITINNPLDVANSNGIDPDHCTNVRISGCHISCAGDGICLKNTKANAEYAPTSGVIISDCTLVSTSAALKIGTEGWNDFSDILVHHCILKGSNRGISIQVRDVGSVYNIHFSDILIETRLFSSDYWGKAEAIALTSFNRDEQTTSGAITGVTFTRITCRGESGIFIASDGDKIRDIVFDKVSLTLQKTSKWPLAGYDLRPRQEEPHCLERPVDALYVLNSGPIMLVDVTAVVSEGQDFGSAFSQEHSTVLGSVVCPP